LSLPSTQQLGESGSTVWSLLGEGKLQTDATTLQQLKSPPEGRKKRKRRKRRRRWWFEVS